MSTANATTAVTYDMGWLPKDAQVVFTGLIVVTPVSGSSVTAATIQISSGGANLYSGQNVFAATGAAPGPTANYYNVGLTPTTEQKLQYILTLTGGATATAGVIYVNIFYVI